ncbi:hypothetical protein SLOPH_691 [Spraguea lophii 42_110]|uniref:Ricin B lectin domain-containing protein n=1 Tax=Spraguea lophii (strain 42_110) TaxID=1358809 RepID=S7W9S4_SPRLO|nr:hypothetical protein SLOPH_691 [Spraguea lophii 42_110]
MLTIFLTIFPLRVFSSEIFYLKVNDVNKYLSTSHDPTVVDNIDSASKYKIETTNTPGEPYILDVSTNRVFDLKGGGTELITWPTKHNGINQQFIITMNNDNGYMIKNAGGQCLEFINYSNKFLAKPCMYSSKSQSFNVITEDELKNKKQIEDLKKEIEDLRSQLKNNTCSKEQLEVLSDSVKRYNRMVNDSNERIKRHGRHRTLCHEHSHY